MFFFLAIPQELNLQPELWKHRVLIIGPPGKYQDFYKYLLLFLAVSFFPFVISSTVSKNILSLYFPWQLFYHLNSILQNPMVPSVSHLSRSVRNTWFNVFLLPWKPFFSWFLCPPPPPTNSHPLSMVNILVLYMWFLLFQLLNMGMPQDLVLICLFLLNLHILFRTFILNINM